jgi:hypothetical protein
MTSQAQFLKRTLQALSLLAMALYMASAGHAQPKPVPGDTDVWVSPSTKVKRVHREGCRRLDRMDKSKLKKTKLADARADGYRLCSRCPGSTTPGKGYNPDLPRSWVNPPRDEVLKKEYVTPEMAPLVHIGDDGKLVYKAYSDHGDRIIDFSYCGYKRSEEPIPTVPVVTTLSPPVGEAKPIEKMQYPVGPDSFETIQAALDKAATMEPDANGFRGAVLLKKGTWYVNRGLLVQSGVVLRGEGDGEDGTRIIFTMPDGNGTGIQVGKGGGTSAKTEMPLTGTLTKAAGDDSPYDWALTLDDGSVCMLNAPRFNPDHKIDDFIGQKVTITLPLITTTQGNTSSYHLKHNMPYSIKKHEDGETIHGRVQGLKFPGETTGEAMPESRITDAYVPTGATQITVEDASGFAAGDLVNVLKTTNEKWIEVLGVGERLRHIRGGKQGAGKRPWKPFDYSHLRRIKAIDGNTITLDVMMPQSIVAEHGGGTVRKATSTKDTLCGVESIRVVSNYDKTEKSNSKRANYGNLKNGIEITAVDGWVRNCTVLHVWYAAVATNGSRQVTVRDCKSLQPVGAVRGGKRYTFPIGGGNCNLVYRCFAEDGRHDYVIGARMAGPFAFVDCEALRGGQSEPHARWGVGTLYDNITLKEGGSLAAINRGDSGSGHGWAAANTVFWNCAANNIVVFDPETEGENNFAIGYTGPDKGKGEYGTGGVKYANTRSGYWRTPKEGVYYGYALMGNGYIESPDGPVKPDSLFKQQLIERIGKDKAEDVLK